MGITAVARSQLKLYQHPDDPHMRVLLQDKSNLAETSPPLMFEVRSVGEHSFRLEWHGKCEFTAATLESKRKGSPTLEALRRDFCWRKLADGPKLVKWLIEEAKGFCSERTLNEAKKNLEIKTVRKESW